MKYLFPFLLIASCRLPDSAGPYIETVNPVETGHDFVGVIGFEARYGGITVGVGILHPDNGVEQTIFKVGFSLF